jgi:hypothetical protein
MHIVRTLVLTGSLLVTAAAIGSAGTPVAKTARKANKQFITCPITHDKVFKSKAIKVTAANGKSTYVCCSDCVAAAQKKLMAKK